MTDAAVLEAFAKAFADVPRPEHFTHRDCCAECREHDDMMRSRDPGSLSLHDVRPEWSPLCLLTPEGFRYYMPAFARLALMDDDAGDFVGSLCFTLCRPISRKCPPRHLRQTAGFTPEQIEAVVLLLKRLDEKRRPLRLEPDADDKQLSRGIRNWEYFLSQWGSKVHS